MAVIDRRDSWDQAARTCRVRVSRHPSGDRDRCFDEFEVPVHERMTTLDALHWIQLHPDPTLSLRHSCLHASCGTCGVRVDGREELACVCMLAECGDEITVEPLANLPVRTDVVVDMDPFYARFPDPHPIIRVSEEPPAAKPPHDLEAYVRLEDCLECGLCLSACPIAATDPSFTDPAALSAAGRLLDEPRGSDREDVLAWISRPEGVWQCTTCMACVEACPAGIEHMPAIIAERRMLIEKGDIDPLLQQLRGATPTREERTWRRTEALLYIGPRPSGSARHRLPDVRAQRRPGG
jgi:succinate dehydrogenase / fumarate reductase iron-sulfur subunit